MGTQPTDRPAPPTAGGHAPLAAALRRALNAAVAGARAALPHAEVTEVTWEPPPRQGTGVRLPEGGPLLRDQDERAALNHA